MIDRARSVWRRVRRKSPKHIAQAIVRDLAVKVDLASLDFPLLDRDIFDAERAAHLPQADRTQPPKRIAWIVVPPSVGSGGHTTLFRMIAAAERAGIDNTVLFYDRYDGDFDGNVARLREGWPWLTCEVAPMPETLDGFDMCVASAWQTAHVLAARSLGTALRRVYFAQDFEAWFYPRGAMAVLAADTYSFGFETLALGHAVHEAIRRETGAEAALVPFGQDTTAYRVRDADAPRSGISVFAKVGNDRRGYRLAVLALRRLQTLRPDVTIHVYGDRMAEAGLRVTNHGYLAPAELNDLYNGAVAGLALSFTNVSLIAAELAAAGAVPVINDNPDARADFAHPAARWARPSPTALADALLAAIDAAGPEQVRAAAAWRGPSWDDTGDSVLAALGVAGGRGAP